jgi:site-specific DNA-cytosine methylase
VRTLVHEVGHGKAVSLPLIANSSLVKNGKASATTFGHATEGIADAARSSDNSDTFTTSVLTSLSPKTASTLATLCCSVLRVIGGYIPETTLPESFWVELSVESPWTLISWKGKPASDCPDGPRYKAMGNSMAVPVMRWIGERLDRVAKEKR